MNFDLTNGLDAIKSGAAFANASSAISKISNVSSSLPPDVAAAMAVQQTVMQAKINAATANIGRDMSIAKANMDMQNKLSFASTGFPANAAVLSAAAGPVAVLSSGPTMLATQANSITNTVASYATHFGVSLPPTATKEELAKAAGDAMTAFHATIPDKYERYTSNNAIKLYPNNDPIISSIYTDFATEPANAANIARLNALSNSMSSLSTATVSSLGAMESSGAASLSSAITDLKEMSTASLITTPTPPALVGALNNTVDYAKIKVTSIQSSINAAVPTVPDVIPGT